MAKNFAQLYKIAISRAHTHAALFMLVIAPTPSTDGALTRADYIVIFNRMVFSCVASKMSS